MAPTGRRSGGSPGDRLPVYLEIGKRRVFAGALDWPGWSRSGRDEESALRGLGAYATRYARAVTRFGLAAPPAPELSDLDVVERVEGNAGTDFGAPMIPPSRDEEPLDEAEAQRLRALLEATWAAFDGAVEAAGSAPLRTGPRGGGRQIDAMVEHVLDADGAYLAKLGGMYRRSGEREVSAEMRVVREVLLETFTARARGEPAQRTPRSGSLWTPRYAVRRSAWHALDHTWEIEDRLPTVASPQTS